jgi:hypothetical protein
MAIMFLSSSFFFFTWESSIYDTKLREIHFSDPFPQVSCPRKLGHKNLRVRVRKVDFPGWKKASLLFQSLNKRK